MENKTDYLPDLDFTDVREEEEENVSVEINEIGEDIPSPVRPQTPMPEDDLEPEQIPKRILKQDDVFGAGPKVMRVADQLDVSQTPVAKPKKQKKPMSDKQKAHMDKIRAKGQLALKEKRERNKKLKEQGLPPEVNKKGKQNKIITEKVKEQEERLVEREVKVVREKEKLSSQEIEDITFNAINRYETIRKGRKIEKKKTQALQQEEHKVKQTLGRAMRMPVDDDPWSQCFTMN
tara:strand:+ start:155 stop:856 length:702 start_codon:yes stop_codon:yes gene_type:complete